MCKHTRWPGLAAIDAATITRDRARASCLTPLRVSRSGRVLFVSLAAGWRGWAPEQGVHGLAEREGVEDSWNTSLPAGRACPKRRLVTSATADKEIPAIVE